MQVILYSLAMDDRYLYKNNKTEEWRGDGEPDAGFSIDSPTLTRVGPISPAKMSQVNYVYIPDLGRYYNITDRSRLGGDFWTLSMSSDAITSFADDIVASRGFIVRAEKDGQGQDVGNPFLTDAEYPVEALSHVQVFPFNAPVSWKSSSEMFFTSGHNVVVVITCRSAAEGSGGGSTALPLQLGCLYAAIDPSNVGGFIDDLAGFFSSAAWEEVVAHIVDVYALPVDPPQSATPILAIVLEGTTAAAGLNRHNAHAFVGVEKTVNFDFPISITWDDSYKDLPPFKQLMLEFVPFGRFQLDMSLCKGASMIRVTVKVNCVTGNASLWYAPVISGNAGDPQYLSSASVLIRSRLSVSQSAGSYVSSTLIPKLTEGVLGIGAGAALGSASPALGAAAIGKALVGSGAEGPASSQVTSDSGGVIGYPTLRLISRESTEAPILYGRPVAEYGVLGDFFGYLSAKDVVLNIPGATQGEIEQIRRRLEAGIFRNS